MKIPGLFTSVLLIITLSAVQAQLDPEIPDNCPKDVGPCTCKPDYEGACNIRCYAVDIDALRKLAAQPNLCEGHVYFQLIHSKVTGIPRDLWKVLLTSKSVDISIMYSKVENVVPPGEESLPALATDGSAIIKIVHSKDISKWQWSQFKNFRAKYDLVLVIDDTPINDLTEDFAHLAGGKVKKVVIDQTPLETLPEEVFRKFENATSLSVQDNKLIEIKRSHFPKPANKLQYLSLNGNNLKYIPADLFTEMPSLQIVYLRENELTTLPANIFSSVTSKTIRLIDLVNNPWECDCDLLSVTKEADGYLDMNYCATPPEMFGKRADRLSDYLDDC